MFKGVGIMTRKGIREHRLDVLKLGGRSRSGLSVEPGMQKNV